MPDSTRICIVCEDKAPGNNYGIPSCFGCKAFFQRTVKLERVYRCFIGKNCDVRKFNRNKCRYCRFQKCLRSGMKEEAIQEVARSRKNTSNSSSSSSPPPTTPTCKLSLQNLQDAETMARGVTGYNRQTCFDKCQFSNSVNGLSPLLVQEDAWRVEFTFGVEWAKNLAGFKELCWKDQISLLRHNLVEILILDHVNRSVGPQIPRNTLVLGNGFRFHRNDKETSELHVKIIDDVLHPLRSVNATNPEILCLKALALLNASGIQLQEPELVSEMRYQVESMFEEMVMSNPSGQIRGRFTRMLLTLLAVARLKSQIPIFQIMSRVGMPLGFENDYVNELLYNGNGNEINITNRQPFHDNDRLIREGFPVKLEPQEVHADVDFPWQ